MSDTNAATFGTLRDAEAWAKAQTGATYLRGRDEVRFPDGRVVKLFSGPDARRQAIGYPSEWERTANPSPETRGLVPTSDPGRAFLDGILRGIGVYRPPSEAHACTDPGR